MHLFIGVSFLYPISVLPVSHLWPLFPSFSAAQRLHGHVANALMADSSALTKPMVWFVQQLGAPEIQQFIIIFTIV